MKYYLFIIPLIYLSTNYGKCEAKSQVINLDENNWKSMLKNEWMVEFYAPWCPACKNIAPTWNEFSSWSDDLGIKTAKIDVTTSPALSGRFLVTALPTIFHVFNGEFRQYRGARDLNSLMSFIEDKKWKSLDTVSSWKNPDSILMSLVSYFFKLSHFLKELNNQLLQEYGLPPWGSYAIFAVGTILLGAILGLILVCVIDFIFPPKTFQRRSFSENKEQKGSPAEVEDINFDELEDESYSDRDYSQSESVSSDNEYRDNELSASEKEDLEEGKEEPNEISSTATADVRKRKPRKAD